MDDAELNDLQAGDRVRFTGSVVRIKPASVGYEEPSWKVLFDGGTSSSWIELSEMQGAELVRKPFKAFERLEHTASLEQWIALEDEREDGTFLAVRRQHRASVIRPHATNFRRADE